MTPVVYALMIQYLKHQRGSGIVIAGYYILRTKLLIFGLIWVTLVWLIINVGSGFTAGLAPSFIIYFCVGKYCPIEKIDHTLLTDQIFTYVSSYNRPTSSYNRHCVSRYSTRHEQDSNLKQYVSNDIVKYQLLDIRNSISTWMMCNRTHPDYPFISRLFTIIECVHTIHYKLLKR